MAYEAPIMLLSSHAATRIALRHTDWKGAIARMAVADLRPQSGAGVGDVLVARDAAAGAVGGRQVPSREGSVGRRMLELPARRDPEAWNLCVRLRVPRAARTIEG